MDVSIMTVMGKLTPWFPGDVKPARPGVYKRKRPVGLRAFGCFSYWDGRRWRMSSSSLKEAGTLPRTPSLFQQLPWRGLTQDPKGKNS